MKEVIIHWVEMRTLEVPDDCPTHDMESMLRWMHRQCPSDGVGFEGFVFRKDTRDLEIVNVQPVTNA